MSSTMLSASLPSVEAYDAFNLSPITVVAGVLASQWTSASRISSATASAVFARFEPLAQQTIPIVAHTSGIRLFCRCLRGVETSVVTTQRSTGDASAAGGYSGCVR
jgi:hypothetical protein